MPVTITVSLSDPYFPVTLKEAPGAASAISSSSIRASTSDSFMGFPLLSEILTVSRLLPMLLISSVTDVVAPLTSETSTTSEITPIMIPSMVRKDRILLEAMDFHAIFTD